MKANDQKLDRCIEACAEQHSTLESVKFTQDESRLNELGFSLSSINLNLSEAQRKVAYVLADEAVGAFYRSKLDKCNIYDYTNAQIEKAVGILAVVAAPPTPQSYFKRAETIASWLHALRDGTPLNVKQFSASPFGFREREGFVADHGRKLYMAARASVLRFYYDAPDPLNDISSETPFAIALPLHGYGANHVEIGLSDGVENRHCANRKP
jgi:hypothetical protein